MKTTIKTLLLIVAFALSGIIFQISCSNADDQNQFIPAQVNKIIFTKGVGATGSIWIADYDGSNLTQVPVNLPSGVFLSGTNGIAFPRLSPDGQKIFIVCMDQNDNSSAIYSCDISGANVQEIYNTGAASSSNSSMLVLGSVN